MVNEFRSTPSRKKNARKTNKAERRFQNVLEVSVRSSQASRQRQRMILGWMTKFLIVAALGTGLYFGVTKAFAWMVLKNPEYNVAELDVQTDGVLDADQVLRTAGLQKGGNIFLVNLSRAQTLIEAIPEVEHVQVSRQVPNRILVEITERKPVAWLSTASGVDTRAEVVASKNSWLLDMNGVVLRPRHAAAQDQFLPVIRHYAGAALTEGAHVEGEDIKAALELIRAHQDSLVAIRFQLQEIDLAKRYGLLVTDRTGTQVLFDLIEMDRQLKRLDTYLQYTDQHGQRLQTINLLVQKYVPVTFMTDPVASDRPADLPPDSSAPTQSATAVPVTPPVSTVAMRTVLTSKEKTAEKPNTKGSSPTKPAVSTSPTAVEKKHDAPLKPFVDSSRARSATQPFLRPPTRVTPSGVQ